MSLKSEKLENYLRRKYRILKKWQNFVFNKFMQIFESLIKLFTVLYMSKIYKGMTVTGKTLSFANIITLFFKMYC